MITLHFEKLFTDGLLADHRIEETMRFVDIRSAKEWTDGIFDRNRKGECDYFVSWVKVDKE